MEYKVFNLTFFFTKCGWVGVGAFLAYCTELNLTFPGDTDLLSI